MDKIMPSYSFSHQFYRQWTKTPETVRAAIVQELTDITTLLKTDTASKTFEFSLPDLDTHLDEMYHSHRAQQAADKARADKEKAEQERLEQEKIETERLEKAQAQEEQARIEKENAAQEQAKQAAVAKENAAKRAQQAAIEQQPVATEEKQTADKTTDTENSTDTILTEQAHTVDVDNNEAAQKTSANNQINAHIDHTPANAAPQTADKPMPSTPAYTDVKSNHEALIHELGVHIDDYLSEQMAQLSEDLKSWLRAEISRQLADKSETTDHESQ